MPRTLPWTTTPAKQSFSSAHASTPVSSKIRDRSGTPSDLVDSDLDPIGIPFTTAQPTSTPRANLRTPSSSPPPAGPPAIEFMRPGPQNDDRWIMVEDEFASTAKLFTAHIHHAEYVRLKRLARSRGDVALRKLDRGTDGVTARTPNLKRKMEDADNDDARVRAGIVGEEGEEGGEDEYLDDPMLAGLMTSSKKRGKDLRSLVSRANTRAAAGYMQSPNKGEKRRDIIKEEKEEMERRSRVDVEEEEDDTDDDDLDAKPREVVRKPVVNKAEPRVKPRETAKFTDRLVQGREEKLVSRPSPKAARTTSMFTTSTTELPPRDPSPTPTATKPSISVSGKGSRAAAIIAQHKAKREEREKEELRKSTAANEVPTFII